MSEEELPIFTLWLESVGVLLEVVGRFPRSLRPTLGHRMVERALEVLETIVELRYRRDRAPLFRRANLALEKLRVLLRIAFQRRAMASGPYGDLAERIERCGRMLGGWARETSRGRQREEAPPCDASAT